VLIRGSISSTFVLDSKSLDLESESETPFNDDPEGDGVSAKLSNTDHNHSFIRQTGRAGHSDRLEALSPPLTA